MLRVDESKPVWDERGLTERVLSPTDHAGRKERSVALLLKQKAVEKLLGVP